MYNEVRTNPKVQLLRPVMFRHWVNLLCLASELDAGGALPSRRDIAYALGVRPTQIDAIVDHLIERDLLIVDASTKQVRCKNFASWQHQSDNVARRVAKHRAKNEPDVTLPVTLPKRPVDTDTDTEVKEPPLSPPLRGGDDDARAKPVKAASRRTRIPDGWMPSEGGAAWARERWAPDVVAAETEKFRDHFGANGKTMLDWEKSWRNWMRNHEQFGPRRRSPSGPPPVKRAPPKPARPPAEQAKHRRLAELGLREITGQATPEEVAELQALKKELVA